MQSIECFLKDVIKKSESPKAAADCTISNRPATILQVWRYAVAILLVLGCAASAEEHQMVTSQPFFKLARSAEPYALSQGVMGCDTVDIYRREGRSKYV